MYITELCVTVKPIDEKLIQTCQEKQKKLKKNQDSLTETLTENVEQIVTQ